MAQQSDYLKIFIQESDELLQQMNQNLLALEREPQNAQALHAIFRSAHTLKSMSASMGYQKIADLAHRMEDLLDQLRSEKIAVSGQIVDALFRSFDCLNAMIEAVQEKKEITADILPALSALDRFIIKGPQVREEKVAGGLTLNEFDKKTLARVKKDGYSSYRVKIVLEENCVLKSVRAFMVFRNLHDVGEVVKSYPDSRALEEEKFDRIFECIFITKEKKGTVKEKASEILDIESVEIEAIDVEDSWAQSDEEAHDDVRPAVEEHARKIQSVRVDIVRLDKLMNLVE